MAKSAEKQSTMSQIIVTSHNPKIVNKLKLSNVLVFANDRIVDFSDIDQKLVNYLAKRPNFDTLKLLFTKRIILVEGPTEEMLINALLNRIVDKISDVEVFAVGHKGFKRYMDIWLKLNHGNGRVKLGVVRDFDNQTNAKMEHDSYDTNNNNIRVRTTGGYTLEDDLVVAGTNCAKLSNYYQIDNDPSIVAEYLKGKKAENMLELCMEITDDSLNLTAPQHIKEVIEWIIK